MSTIESAITTWTAYGCLLGGVIVYGIVLEVKHRRELRRDREARRAAVTRTWEEETDWTVQDVVVLSSGRVVPVHCLGDSEYQSTCQALWDLPATTSCPREEL